jgi:hypothetical protein
MKKILKLIPDLQSSGFLDRSGGAVALREDRGILVSPENAGELMEWQLAAEDLVLFPGGGDASMARAGRRPSHANRWLRAILAVRREWRCSVQSMAWGGMSFALAGVELPLHNVNPQLFKTMRDSSVPLISAELDSDMQLERLQDSVAKAFGRSNFAAVLIEGEAVIVAGSDLSLMPAALQTIEGLARAQQRLLYRQTAN